MACLRSEARSYRFVPLTPKGKGGHLHFALQNKVVHPIFPQTHFPNKFDKLFQYYNSQGTKSSYMKSCYAYCTYTRLSLIRADNSTLLSEHEHCECETPSWSYFDPPLITNPVFYFSVSKTNLVNYYMMVLA